MKIHIRTEQDLKRLDNKIDFDEAADHFAPYLVCSEETKKMLDKYKENRFPKLEDLEEYKDPDMYYISTVRIDNTLPFGEVEVKEFR
jgi:hypothetical protein